ncbi:TPA: DUF2975 domain-containing protein [Stenotrophomonas maltophilia]
MRSTSSTVRLARALRLAAWIGAIGSISVTTLAVLAQPNASGLVAIDLFSDGLPHAWAAALALVEAAVNALALGELARMLGRIETGKLFSAAAIRHFRRFAGLLALAAVLRVALPPLSSFLIAWRDGQHAVSLALDGGDVLAILPTAVFFLVAQLFDEAAHLEDDSQSIV